MLRKGSAIALFVTVLALVSLRAVAVASQGTGEVGGPPTIALGPPDEGTQASPALVIGAGSVLNRRVELVAYAWKPPADSFEGDFCIWAEQPPEEIEFGTCATALGAESKAVAVDMQIQQISPRHARSTTIGGRIAPEVAAVRLYFHRPSSKKRHRVDGLVSQVDGDLQQRLKQPAPFGFFYARVRGLVRFSAFKVQALDSSGNVLGAAGR